MLTITQIRFSALNKIIFLFIQTQYSVGQRLTSYCTKRLKSADYYKTSKVCRNWPFPCSHGCNKEIKNGHYILITGLTKVGIRLF